MKRRTFRLLAAVLLPILACAHGAAVATDPDIPVIIAPSLHADQVLLAAAFNLMVGAAPPAARYVLQIDGAPAEKEIVQGVASVSGLVVSGRDVVDPKAATRAIVTIRSGRVDRSQSLPGDRGPRVNIAYQLGGLLPVHCTLALNPTAGLWAPYFAVRDGRASGPEKGCFPRRY